MEYYRNKETIENIEPQSLWYLSEDKQNFILVDDDEFVMVIFDKGKFTATKKPLSEP